MVRLSRQYAFALFYNYRDTFGFWDSRRELNIDSGLRALRLSYGAVNTILVLILLKPFHEPILTLIDGIFRKNRQKTASAKAKGGKSNKSLQIQ